MAGNVHGLMILSAAALGLSGHRAADNVVQAVSVRQRQLAVQGNGLKGLVNIVVFININDVFAGNQRRSGVFVPAFVRHDQPAGIVGINQRIRQSGQPVDNLFDFVGGRDDKRRQNNVVGALIDKLYRIAGNQLADDVSSLLSGKIKAFADGNRIQPEQLDKWLKTAGKIAVTVGALAVANKARHGILGIMDFFSAGKKGGTSSALGALAANGRPIPVYVVNGGALGAAGLADGMDMFGGGKSGKFGKVGRFLARHRGLAKAVQYGGKALKYGGKALGVAGMAYSAYELTQAQNSTQLGGSIGTIAGGLIGSIGGPLGMVAGAYIGNYLGEKIGGLFDKLPEENAKALESERALNVLKSQSDTKIHLDINSPGADVTLRKIEDNSPENNITRIDMSLGGRSYAP